MGTNSGKRRQAIGDTAIAIVAREGLRALTHRAVDRELGLPTGSTSFYVRTRGQLIESMVHRLAARATADLPPDTTPPTTVGGAAEELAALVDAMALRAEDHRVRWALDVDLVGEAALHALLTHASPVRTAFLSQAEGRLAAVGVPHPAHHAPALVCLIDALLFDRLAGSGVMASSRVDARALFHAYLTGLAQPAHEDGP